MNKNWLICLFFAPPLFSVPLQAQTIARFTFNAINNKIAAPVSINLDQLTTLNDSALSLREISGKSLIDVPFQVEQGQHRFLWFVVKQGSNPSQKRVFELVKRTSSAPAPPIVKVKNIDGALVIQDDNRNVVQYNYQVNYPPAGVDSAYRRSGFIHPLYSPSGKILTQINPKDHYHHFGIWNPWTDVFFQQQKIDFWNIGDKKGTVRFAGMIDTEQGPIFGGFQALQEHVVLPNVTSASEKIAMNEVWSIRIFHIGSKGWLVDFTSTINCATSDTVFLKEYRYGGFGFRATADWNNQNSKVLTSEGKTRKDADASIARWCNIHGDVTGGHSGVLFMDHPSNFNHPEPMRVWPENQNGRGDVFFSFSPTRNKDWTIVPGNKYSLTYRMFVYDGTISDAESEEIWKSFAKSPEFTITKINSNP